MKKKNKNLLNMGNSLQKHFTKEEKQVPILKKLYKYEIKYSKNYDYEDISINYKFVCKIYKKYTTQSYSHGSFDINSIDKLTILKEMIKKDFETYNLSLDDSRVKFNISTDLLEKLDLINFNVINGHFIGKSKYEKTEYNVEFKESPPLYKEIEKPY